MATFTVFVKAVSGQVFETLVSPSETVKDLKEKISKKTGLPANEQRYLFAGKQLQDEQRLAACGLTKECIINLVKREAYAQQCLCSLNVDEDICNTPLSAPSGKTTGPSKQQQQAATDNTDTKKAPAPRHQKGAPPVSAPITTEPQSTLLPLHQEDAPAVEVKDVNVEQQRLLSRLVKLCAEFNEEFDWHKYKEIQAIRKTLIAQRVLDRAPDEHL